jgi:glycine betaine/choline ABC-type transport system substrate-binding protein
LAQGPLRDTAARKIAATTLNRLEIGRLDASRDRGEHCRLVPLFPVSSLDEKKVDLISGNSTDGLIQKFNLAILKDDRRYFPPDEAFSVFTRSVLAKYPRVRTAIGKLSGKISAADMQRLNYEADAEFRALETVFCDFLQNLI